MTTSAPSDAMTMRTISDLMRSGRLPAARAAADGAIAAGVVSDRLLALAGMLAWRLADPAGAAAPLRLLLARQPGDRATRLNLAAALTEMGLHAEVAELLEPLAGDPAADRLRAFAAQQTGDHVRAVALYQAVLKLHPDDTDSWNNLGNAHAAQDAIDDAVHAFERAITLRPGDVRLYLNLAGVLESADRRAARLRVMRDAAALAPDDPQVLLALGLAEAAEGKSDAAEATFERAIVRAPDSPAAYLELGLLLENRNKLEALDALVARAGSRIGGEAALLAGWAAFRAKRFEEAAAFAQSIPATVNPIRRLHLLAQIADRRGAPADAFALFSEMNRASVGAALPPPPGPTYRERVQIDNAALHTAAPTARGPRPPGRGIVPIFIVGFPRSGTTLLDAMLGSLPDTYVLEERPLLTAVEARIAASATVATLSEAEVATLRTHYFAALGTLAPDFAHVRLIDKHPLHMARMPLIQRLFPTAPVLLVERHPYDVVLSCFMANFELNYAMRSFTSLAEAARTYDAVFTAWTLAEERFALPVHRVRYERLVDDPPGELARLFAFLAIDADPATLDHQTAARDRGPINTASYAQVTEPIYRRSLDRWRKYADQLAPVIPILRPWAIRMGYDAA